MRNLILVSVVAGLLFALGIVIVFAGEAPSPPVYPSYSFCGACTQDSDCGVDNKCCHGDCPDNQMKCYQVATCP